MGRRLLPAAGLLLLAACAAPAPEQPGESWRLWTESGTPTAAARDGEFAVLPFTAPPGSADGVGETVRAALAAALRDRGRTTLSEAWVAQQLPGGADAAPAGVCAVEGAVLRWEDHAEQRWLRAVLGFRLCVGGEEQVRGRLQYTCLLSEPEAAGLEVEDLRRALIAGLAGRLAAELVEQPD